MGNGLRQTAAALGGAGIMALILLTTQGSSGSVRTGDRANGAASSSARTSPAESRLRGLRLTGEEESWVREQVEGERVRRDEARILEDDSGLKIVERVRKSGADPMEVIADFDQFQAHVHPATGPRVAINSTGEVTTVSLQDDAASAELIEFGPGKFVLAQRGTRFSYKRESIKHLEIRGAGMDKTTLTLSTSALLTVAENLENLRVSNLTIDAGKQGSVTLDIRGGAAAIFENVRFQAWHTGAGYSAPIGFAGRAYLGFRNCEWLGGAGYRGGTALSMRGTGLVTFDGCLFADVARSILGTGGAPGGSAVYFNNCTWENSKLTDVRILMGKEPAYPIYVVGGTVFTADRENWGAQFAARVEGVAFQEGLPRCTIGRLIETLRRLPPDVAERIVSIAAFNPTREGTVEFVLHVQNSSEFRSRLREQNKPTDNPLIAAIRPSGEVAVKSSRGRYGLPQLPGRPRPEPVERLLAILERCNLDQASEAYGLARILWPSKEGPIPAISIVTGRDGRAKRYVDARTGAPLKR